jgi:hypothetical protein
MEPFFKERKMAKLVGTVAAILNDRELVVNLGAEAGLKLGNRFKVLEKPLDVRDPSTGEVLGQIARDKIRVKVVELQAKLCIARTYETYNVNVGGDGISIADLMPKVYAADMLRSFQPRKMVTKVRTLATDDNGLSPIDPMAEKASFVKVGDPVELLEDEDIGPRRLPDVSGQEKTGPLSNAHK